MLELRPIPLFPQLPQSALEELATKTEVVEYPAGALIHSGETSGSFWVLLEGTWRNRRFVRGSSTPLVVERDRPGTWFGGIDFVDLVAPMEARATQDGRFLKVPAEVMAEPVRHHPSVAVHLMRGVQADITWFLAGLEKEKA